jgi:hypothetical protein
MSKNFLNLDKSKNSIFRILPKPQPIQFQKIQKVYRIVKIKYYCLNSFSYKGLIYEEGKYYNIYNHEWYPERVMINLTNNDSLIRKHKINQILKS